VSDELIAVLEKDKNSSISEIWAYNALKRLQEQIQDMLVDKAVDHRQLIK
jgi:hypothetical protein